MELLKKNGDQSIFIRPDINNPATANKMKSCIKQNSMNSFAKTFINRFNSRYANSFTGIEAPFWIKREWEEIAKRRSDISTQIFEHPGWAQPSVIATIQGSEGGNDLVILGAHLDSTSIRDGPMTADKPAPGADDDASGIVVITEALRAIVRSNYKPKKTVQIHAYAIEELGLFGSRDIAKRYSQEGFWNVIGMTTFDMVGYKGKSNGIWLTKYYSNVDHSRFLCELVDEYMSGTKCALYGEDWRWHGASDHRAWYEQGFPSTFASEASGIRNNPYYHTESDTYQTIDMKYVADFAKLAVVYLSELAKGNC